MRTEQPSKWNRSMPVHLWEYIGPASILLMTGNLMLLPSFSAVSLLIALLLAGMACLAAAVKRTPMICLGAAGFIVLIIAALYTDGRLFTGLLIHTVLCALLAARFRLLLAEREKYKEQSEEMEYMAYHDALTGLPNRRLFEDRLKQSLLHACRNNQMVAVLFLDLDRFKDINDKLGHAYGDMLICQAGQRLLGCLRGGDTVYRQGGDEFTILLEHIAKPEDVRVVASRIQAALERPFMLDQHPAHVTASIGIALYPLDGATPEQLMTHADEAMYAAKERGDNGYQFYAAEIDAMVAAKTRMEEALRYAMEHRELELHYQPLYELTGSKLVGMEAVLRWRKNGKEIVPNEEWMKTADDAGLMIPIGTWALQMACLQAKAWQEEGYPPLKLVVGISASQFKDEHFIDIIAELLKRTGLDPSCLELDLAEGISRASVQEVSDKLRILKAFGLRITMDDLCTGLFTLSDANQMPMDTVKLDSALIRDLPEDDENRELAFAIMRMAKRLQLGIVAKGVDTQEQLEHLQALQCKEVQGNLFSRPLHPEEFQELMKQKIS